MAERKAVNKYYPPEWTPQKGSINKFRGTHALRERARKLHMGILIIRFEMPFNIWCEGCSNHIGMGVRYNAEKTKVGMYYTTPIYKFRMKCHLCTNHFEIQTDPQNLDYVILNGARRQERRWDPQENEQVAPDDKDVGKKLAVDAMYRLEHGAEDKAKKKALAPSLARLEEYQERMRDDYAMNSILRKKFRDQKKSLKAIEEQDNAILKRASLNIKLLPETEEDAKLAGLLKLNAVDSYEDHQKKKREQIISRPLFTSSKLTKSGILSNLDCITKAKQLNLDKTTATLSTSELGIKKIKNAANNTPFETATKESNNCSLVAMDYDSTSDENVSDL